MRWLRDMFRYSSADWTLVTVVLVGLTIAGSVWLLRGEVSRLVDVLGRTHCTCEPADRIDDLLR